MGTDTSLHGNLHRAMRLVRMIVLGTVAFLAYRAGYVCVRKLNEG
jgi:hypothetical protein